MESKSVSIDHGKMENLTITEISKDDIGFHVKALGKFSMPKKEFFDGVDKFRRITETVFDCVKKLDKEQLRSLLIEIRHIGNLDKPRYAKQSKEMKELFQLEKSENNYWSDQYSCVRRAIEVETLDRIIKNTW